MVVVVVVVVVVVAVVVASSSSLREIALCYSCHPVRQSGTKKTPFTEET